MGFSPHHSTHSDVQEPPLLTMHTLPSHTLRGMAPGRRTVFGLTSSRTSHMVKGLLIPLQMYWLMLSPTPTVWGFDNVLIQYYHHQNWFHIVKLKLSLLCTEGYYALIGLFSYFSGPLVLLGHISFTGLHSQ